MYVNLNKVNKNLLTIFFFITVLLSFWLTYINFDFEHITLFRLTNTYVSILSIYIYQQNVIMQEKCFRIEKNKRDFDKN